MSETFLEIHVPLTREPGAPGRADEDDYLFPWIDDVEALLADLEGPVEEYENGAEWSNGDGEPEYLFFVAGGTEAELAAVARSVALLASVPTGVYATMNDAAGETGEGEPVDIGL